MSFIIERCDITKLQVDAIVNATNTALLMDGGVSGIIFEAAGAEELQSACNNLAPIKIGEAVITDGFQLQAKYIIHTAGPVYYDGQQGEEEMLRLCYLNSLALAVSNGCKSIAFPLISSGIYAYPKAEALQVATSAIRDFLFDHDISVTLSLFDKEAFSLFEKLLEEVQNYIGDHYVEERVLLPTPHLKYTFSQETREAAAEKEVLPVEDKGNKNAFFDKLDEPFSKTLLCLIRAKGKTNAEVYKRANIDRKLFSKISNNKNMPSKKTVVAFAVALELDFDEAKSLLERAGYALSSSVVFDVIIEYFLQNRKYDIFEINEVLYHYDQSILGE